MCIGKTGEATLTVAGGDSAKRLIIEACDDFPDVFATSRMIALMETAAARAMRGLLTPGQLSVGVGVDVRHLAATPIGAAVHARATCLGMEGKLYRFAIQAFDAGGLIGEGEHTRAVVDATRLESGAAGRVRDAMRQPA
jgi:predicted thioesterase